MISVRFEQNSTFSVVAKKSQKDTFFLIIPHIYDKVDYTRQSLFVKHALNFA